MSGAGVGTRLAYVTRSLPPYRTAALRGLNARGVNCRAIVAGRANVRDSWRSSPAGDCRVVYLRGRPYPIWRGDVVQALEATAPDAILLEHGASLDFTWTILLSPRLAHVPKVLWTHGIERRELFSGQWTLSSRGRWWQLQRSNALICYDHGMALHLSAMYPGKVVGAASNSTDGAAITETISGLTKLGHTAVRRQAGLGKEFYLLALGRLVPEKEFHRVISILKSVRRMGFDAGAIFVGDGPELGRIRLAMHANGFREGEDVAFAGSISDQVELARWLYCADVSIQPGALGLAVVDSLFAGVPTVTPLPGRAGPYHGPEWKYVANGERGWLVPSNSDEALAEQIAHFLRLSAAERRAIGQACSAFAESSLGIRQMVDGILDVVGRAIQANVVSATA